MAGLAAKARRKYSYCSKGSTKDSKKLMELLEYSASESLSEPDDADLSESAISSCGDLVGDAETSADQTTKCAGTERVSEVNYHFTVINTGMYTFVGAT